MVGSYHIIIQNSIVKYEFDIKRNITIIKGDSATGKTVLVDMIRDYVSNGSDSGVSLSCPTACRVIEGNTINLRHLMDFGDGDYQIRILNENAIVHNKREMVPIAGKYV